MLLISVMLAIAFFGDPYMPSIWIDQFMMSCSTFYKMIILSFSFSTEFLDFLTYSHFPVFTPRIIISYVCKHKLWYVQRMSGFRYPFEIFPNFSTWHWIAFTTSLNFLVTRSFLCIGSIMIVISRKETFSLVSHSSYVKQFIAALKMWLFLETYMTGLYFILRSLLIYSLLQFFHSKSSIELYCASFCMVAGSCGLFLSYLYWTYMLWCKIY